jgi:hypothetical protein
MAKFIPLGHADSFVICGEYIENQGKTILKGNVSTFRDHYSILGFPPGIIHGVIHENDSVASDVRNSVIEAFRNASEQSPAHSIVNGLLDNLVLLPGIYTPQYSSYFSLNTTLTLDANGDPNAVWIFQAFSLTTGPSSKIVFENEVGSSDRVYWRLLTANIGLNSHVIGNIIAYLELYFAENAQLNGRALSCSKQINLCDNHIYINKA